MLMGQQMVTEDYTNTEYFSTNDRSLPGQLFLWHMSGLPMTTAGSSLLSNL